MTRRRYIPQDFVGKWRRNALGDYEIHKSSGGGPTGEERWACRNPDNQCTDEETQQLAESLVALKHLIKDMTQEEKRIKNALASRLKQNQWSAVTYKNKLNIVEHARTPQTRLLNTKKTISVVTKWLGEEKAAELVTIASRRPKTNSGIYVRLDVEVERRPKWP